jgi:hypothetical protein
MHRNSTGSNPWTRRVLVCVIVASITIALVDRMRASSAPRPRFDASSSLVVQLTEAEGYGNARIRIGNREEQPFAANSAALAENLMRQIEDSACTSLVLRVSGGVRQGEVQRLHDVVVQAVDGASISVHLALADEQPILFGEVHDDRSADQGQEAAR